MEILYIILFELKEIHKKVNQILGKTIYQPVRRYRNSKLINKDFSIISNNCWGGSIYQKLNLPYTSPTIGLYFYADDYIKFLSNLDYYLSLTPIIIQKKDSKYKEELDKLKVYRYFPIGKLDDIEIIFVHYRNDEDAIAKWEKRKQRLNIDNLIVKFNDQNNFQEKHLVEFEQLPYRYKICFTAKKYSFGKSLVVKSRHNREYIKSDMRCFKKPINMINFINKMVYKVGEYNEKN